MVRVREVLKKGLPLGAGVVVGALLATLLAGGAARATVGGPQPQDPAVQMQIQQALGNFQIQLQNELNLMRSKISTLEQEQRNLRFQMDTGNARRAGSAAPIPADPIPGVTTYGRLVSEAAESERFVLKAARGDLLAQLGMTADGPGLILFDASGHISVALLATPQGAELRMVDADGVLQTVVAGQ
jgi:hypothetical protein